MTDGGSTEAQQAALKQCAEAKQSKLLDDPGFRTPNVTLDPISNLHSIGLHTTNIRASNGGLYTVNTEKPCYKLFREGGVDGRGRLSPTVKVTLGDEAKKALGIPASAMHFALSLFILGYACSKFSRSRSWAASAASHSWRPLRASARRCCSRALRLKIGACTWPLETAL